MQNLKNPILKIFLTMHLAYLNFEIGKVNMNLKTVVLK